MDNESSSGLSAEGFSPGNGARSITSAAPAIRVTISTVPSISVVLKLSVRFDGSSPYSMEKDSSVSYSRESAAPFSVHPTAAGSAKISNKERMPHFFQLKSLILYSPLMRHQ